MKDGDTSSSSSNRPSDPALASSESDVSTLEGGGGGGKGDSNIAPFIYTIVLTRVQLTSGREPSFNPPMNGLSQSRLQSKLAMGGVHTGGKSGLELSCKRGF